MKPWKFQLSLLFIICLISSLTQVFAQQYTYPEGYTSFLDYDDQEQRVSGDFDLDGQNDLAIVCTSEDMDMMVAVYLSTKWNSDKIYYTIPWYEDMNTLSFENNVLSIASNGCVGRCYMELKFKYYQDLQNMKLIGYDEGRLPDYNQEGAFDLSINLNTGIYEVGNVRKKVSLDLITLANIELYLDALSEVGSNEH
ncbi:MAG: hypothetical protein RLZZ531_1979 [Bacteroidota bacterium]|jgi:hypothetical protein